jgi:tetratricopeptide (TPR) repeat protein
MHRVVALAVFLAVAGSAWADNYLVLPFFNQSKDKNLDWIGDSLAEAIRDALASEGLVALDRPDRNEAFQRLSVRPYTVLTKATVVKIGQELDAEQVIYGQFELKPPASAKEKTRGTLQVTTYLLDLKHMKQGPQYGELGALEDLATLQRHLAWQTLQFVIPKTAPSEADFTRRHPAVRLDAIENYVRGLLIPGMEDKHRFFTQAARLDERFTQPCFQLGRLDLERKEYKSAAAWFQKVTSNDVHYREATFLLGLSRYYSGDYANAERAFQAVANVVPLNEVFNNLGASESRRNLPQAIENFQKALEGDESDPAYHFNLGYALWKQGRFDEAAARFRAVLERNPGDEQATALLDRCQKRSGPRTGDTKMEALERVKANYSESAWWQLKAALQPQKK